MSEPREARWQTVLVMTPAQCKSRHKVNYWRCKRRAWFDDDCPDPDNFPVECPLKRVYEKQEARSE